MTSEVRVAEPYMPTLVPDPCACFAIGALIGAFHYLTLRKSAQILITRTSVLKALTLQLGRFAVTAGALGIITSHYGAMPSLVAMLGVLVSRTAVLRSGADT